MTYLEFLADAIHKVQGHTAKHVETVPILETHEDRIAWQGNVEIFELSNQARCYAWGFEDDDGVMKAVTVLAAPPITNPRKAVQAYIVSTAK
jgi:hypothetical protein